MLTNSSRSQKHHFRAKNMEANPVIFVVSKCFYTKKNNFQEKKYGGKSDNLGCFKILLYQKNISTKNKEANSLILVGKLR